MRGSQQVRGISALQGMPRHAGILVRITAIAAVAAVLVLSPLLGAGSDVRRRIDALRDQPIRGQGTAFAIANAIGDGEDDDGDEDGANEDDDAEADDSEADDDDDEDADTDDTDEP
jgi:hypothetical protein